jgi:hypothetical protein
MGMMFLHSRSLLVLAALAWSAASFNSAAAAAAPLEFRVSFAPAVSTQPFSGRIVVMLSTGNREPRFGPNWFNPEPMFAVDVKQLAPGQAVTVGAAAIAFPKPLADLPKGSYAVQAIMDFDRGSRQFANAPGNGYSVARRLELDPATSGPIDLTIDQVVKPTSVRDSDRVKFVSFESPALSRFHGRAVHLHAGVVLPASYDADPERKYPAIYDIPGFGGNHLTARFLAGRNVTEVAGVEMIYIVLDPDCRWGHHVFADSANNGPCGAALIEELIPHLEKQFRIIPKSTARFVTGHSSGGWSSLWLQVTYPDTFGGVWSTAPDPVDFRDFQRINLYVPGTNMFTDGAGQPRPLARRGDRPVLYYQPFSDMEEVMGHGGQLGSFEAVFSPRGQDGRPVQLWDRRTGAINPDVAKAWEKYDIRLTLERQWSTLGPKLQGKLHVYMGELDTFYLEGATRLLKESLAKLGSDAKVELFPGKDHGTLLDRSLRERMAQEMAAAFRRHHPDLK